MKLLKKNTFEKHRYFVQLRHRLVKLGSVNEAVSFLHMHTLISTISKPFSKIHMHKRFRWVRIMKNRGLDISKICFVFENENPL